jgi:[acyl-carrier-protein] S-malonyltransferase
VSASNERLSVKERVVIICPGRGSYTKENLGGLQKFRPLLNEFFSRLDTKRAALGAPTITELDQEVVFKPQVHTKGENASVLIYAYSYADYLNLDQEKYEVVAVTGNSMGWYTALAVAKALDVDGAFEVINTMGSMMQGEVVGGQIIYPVVNEQWQVVPNTISLIDEALQEVNKLEGCQAWISICLGGYRVIGGNQKALDFLLKKLPKYENYPFQLINHAAFHTPLMKETSRKALSMLEKQLFHQPKLPLIDGQGRLWTPWSTDLEELHEYTFTTQVTEKYDFSKAVTVALKEFCPDKLVLLGPGNTLGGALGQILIENDWHSLKSKTDFVECQKANPFLLSLGRV